VRLVGPCFQLDLLRVVPAAILEPHTVVTRPVVVVNPKRRFKLAGFRPVIIAM
jgi:hypothetical protein